MAELAKGLIIIGFVIMVSGASLYFIGKIPGVGRLPGDILIKRENFSFYFPIVTCLLISLIFSFLFYLWNQK